LADGCVYIDKNIAQCNTAYVTVSQSSFYKGIHRRRRFIPNQEAQKSILRREESSFVFALPSKCNGSRNTEA